ncbi:MAG: hypothetical protein HYV15_06360, partial [Elusimicrobia bacterium]|nr:hypothetical protein [Elusimicrobiota bacterium]
GMLEAFLNAAEACGGKPGEYHAFQRRFYADLAGLTRTMLAPVRLFVDAPRVRERAAALEGRCRAVLGRQGLLGRGVEALALLNFALAARRGAVTPPVYAPGPRWTYYNQDPAGRVLVRKGRGAPVRARGRLRGVFG